jgi:hypothetical protein
MSENHFSESVTFTAEGLDDIITQTRKAREETDSLAYAQERAADKATRRQRAMERQQRANGSTQFAPGDPRLLAGRAGFDPRAMNASLGLGGSSRINQPIRITAATVHLVTNASGALREAAMRYEAERQAGRRHRDGASLGGLGAAGVAAVGAANAIAKTVATAAKHAEQVKPKEELTEARGAFGLSGRSNAGSILAANIPTVAIDPKSLEGLSASARAKAVREMMNDPRADAQERFRAAMDYKPNVAFETKIANPTAPDAVQDIGMIDFAKQMKESLQSLTAKQLQELASESGLSGYSKMKKGQLVNFMAGQAVNRVEDANQTDGRKWVENPDWQKEYVAEMRRITSVSATVRRGYEQARDSVGKFANTAKAWATSPEMKARYAGAQAYTSRKWDEWGRDATRRAGYVGLGIAGGAVGMGMAGLQQTVTGQRFNNEILRLEHELANVFGPALRKATEYLGSFSNALSEMSPRQQRNLMYAGLGVTGYGALRAAGMGGLVEKPLGWAAGAGMMGVARAAPLIGKGGAWAGGLAAAGIGKVAAAGGVAAKGGLIGAAMAGGYLIGNALSPWVFNGIDDREEAYKRRSRADFSEAELHQNKGYIDELERVMKSGKNPEDVQSELRKRQKMLLKEQEAMEGQYSTFGRLAGSFTIGGYSPFGSYGRRSEELQTKLQITEKIQAGHQIEADKKNKENLAGGGFEGFLDTYRRTEEAVGKIDPGLRMNQDNLANDELKAIRGLMQQLVNGAGQAAAKQDAIDPPKFQRNH